MTHENGKLFIEFKPPVTDEAIDIRKLANKLVEGQADGGQIIQIFVKLKTMGMVKGTMAPGSSYTFKDTPIMQGLSPKGKVDVSFLYNLGFVKKPANVVVEPPKQAEGGFDLFKAVGDFFGSLFQFRSSDVKENVVEVKRVDDKITIPATKQKMDYSEFQNEKWLNYQNKYYIAEPDGSGSGDGLYLKMPDFVSKKYPTSRDFWNVIIKRWKNQEANYRLIDLSDIVGSAKKYEYEYLSEEHQNQIDKMIRENPKLTKDILAQTFGNKEASIQDLQEDLEERRCVYLMD